MPAAKKAAATKKSALPVAAPTAASIVATPSAAGAVEGDAVIDLNKAVSHVVASLGKTTSKPAKQAKLVAASVRYALQSA